MTVDAMLEGSERDYLMQQQRWPSHGAHGAVMTKQNSVRLTGYWPQQLLRGAHSAVAKAAL